MEDKNGRLPTREADPMEYEYPIDSPFGGDLAALQHDIRDVKKSIRTKGADESLVLELKHLQQEMQRVWNKMCRVVERAL